MNCFIHERVAAAGLCVLCQRAVCRECIGRDAPRLVCRTCVERRPIMGFEYRSSATIAGWPLIHVCAGVDPVTMRPRVAKGVVAIGNVAIGAIAVAGVACGFVTLGGLSVGLLFALGGAALGLGLSAGGLAVGSIAVGGAAIGFSYAVGGVAFGPAVIDGARCDPEAADFLIRWLGSRMLPPHC
jgi:hypothetical protein